MRPQSAPPRPATSSWSAACRRFTAAAPMRLRRSRISIFPSATASSSRSSVRPAAASPRCSRSSPACCRGRTARRCSTAPRSTGPRKDIGVVFQSPVLFPWRSVLGNVLLPVDVQQLGRERMTQRALDLLALVGLSGFEHRYPWELSGGMQQRVALVRALIHDPGVAPDGRAVRRARCADARGDERRAAAHLAGAAQDRGVHHPFDRRGGVPRRPGDGDDAAAGPHRRPVRGRAGATALARRHDDGSVRQYVRAVRAQLSMREEGSNDSRTAKLHPAPAAPGRRRWPCGKALVRVLAIPAFILPTPTSIFMALYRGIASMLYIEHIWTSRSTETLLGFVARLRRWRSSSAPRSRSAAASNISFIPSSSCSSRCRRWRWPR